MSITMAAHGSDRCHSVNFQVMFAPGHVLKSGVAHSSCPFTNLHSSLSIVTVATSVAALVARFESPCVYRDASAASPANKARGLFPGHRPGTNRQLLPRRGSITQSLRYSHEFRVGLTSSQLLYFASTTSSAMLASCGVPAENGDQLGCSSHRFSEESFKTKISLLCPAPGVPASSQRDFCSGLQKSSQPGALRGVAGEEG